MLYAKRNPSKKSEYLNLFLKVKNKTIARNRALGCISVSVGMICRYGKKQKNKKTV
jgi:hypothetical protein